MKKEPTLSIEEIKNALQENYDLYITKIDFIPEGMCSWNYHIFGNDEKEYHLKLFQVNTSAIVPSLESLQLTHILRTDYSISEIPNPYISKNGQLIFQIGNYSAVLFDHINAIIEEKKRFNDEEWYKLGVLLGKIHSLTPHFSMFPVIENFENTFIKDGKRLLESLTNYKRSHSNIVKVLLPILKKLQTVIKEFELVQTTLKNNPDIAGTFVLCHSDPTPGNIMSDAEGNVFLIDWDACLLAPKEKDLVCIQEMASAMKGYRWAIGDFDINKEAFRYYQLCWTIDLILDHISEDFNIEKDIPEENIDHLKKNLKEFGLID